MALIVEKYPFVGTTGQCLILNQRERLVYPFNFGEYSEIRFGMFFSFTSGQGNNADILSNDTSAQNSAVEQIFVGFSNYNTGTKLPGQASGYDYIGVYGYGSTSNCGIKAAAPNLTVVGGVAAGSPDNIVAGTTNITGGNFALNGFTAGVGFDPGWRCPNSATGATSYAGMFGMRLVMSGSNAAALQTFSNNTTFASDVSTAALRTSIASLGNYRSTMLTGFFTSGADSAGGRMMTPNSVFVYMPMLNSRIRIHNLAVERYA